MNEHRKRAVTGPPVAASYSPAIAAEGPLLFVSGQVASRDGELVSGPIEVETELADFAGMDAVYRRIFPEPLPS